MQEVFSKIIEKLEEKIKEYDERIERRNGACCFDETDKIRKLDDKANGIEQAIEIVKQEAEKYNNDWISCSDRLPEESGEYLTWVEYDGDRFIAIDEIDCDGIIKEWNCSTDYKVIAWQPLPQPYQSKGE